MLTKLFNSNSISSLALLIILAIVLWSKTFINVVPLYDTIPVSPLYKLVFTLFHEYSIISAVISIALIITEALLLNQILAENDLIPKNTYLAAYIFIIISSLFIDVVLFNPIIIINIFIILVIGMFLRLYEKHEAYATVFNIGTLLSVASMFYFPSFIFILLLWVGFIIYRVFSWREWFISILGLILPYIFLGTFYFWNDCFETKVESYKNALALFSFHNFHFSLYGCIIVSFLGIILILSLFKFIVTIGEKQIRIRKYLSLIIWFFLVSCIAILPGAKYGILTYVMIIPSASVLITLYLSNMKKQLWAEGILISLALLLIAGRLGLFSLLA
jgi:hypothetical protein